MVVVSAPEDAVVLAPPSPPDRPIEDVGAAVRDALRFPLAGPPLESLVPRGARVTLLVESPALPIPAPAKDPRQAGVVAAAEELERLGVPTERQTILVAAGLAPPTEPPFRGKPGHPGVRAALPRRGRRP